jgi:DNA-binding NarL/FixJ family response regulator
MLLIFCDDLIFTSKIAATARAHGIESATARTQEWLVKKMQANPAGCVVVDLHNATLNWGTLFEALGEARPRFVGFGSHVDTETLKAARDAGCDLVMPRSQFTKLLETDLPKWVEA